MEMLLERVRSITRATFDLFLFMTQKMLIFFQVSLWIGTNSFMILVLPVVFNTENLQMDNNSRGGYF
jgi:import receptor subunit TOM22